MTTFFAGVVARVVTAPVEVSRVCGGGCLSLGGRPALSFVEGLSESFGR